MRDAGNLRRGQCALIDFAVRRQREVLKGDNHRRHHKVRQLRAQRLAQRIGMAAFARFCRYPRNKLPASRAALPGAHQRLGHRCLLLQSRFHFSQLNAEAANFDLLIATVQVLQHAILAPAHLVAGAIHTRAVGGEGVSNKMRRSQAGVAVISARQPNPGNIELTGHADRHRVEVSIKDIKLHIVERCADRYRHPLRDLRHGPRGSEGGGFRRPVAVHHHKRGVVRHHLANRVCGEHIAARNQ